MAAEFEEVVVDPAFIQFEHFGPDPRQPFLIRRSRL